MKLPFICDHLIHLNLKIAKPKPFSPAPYPFRGQASSFIIGSVLLKCKARGIRQKQPLPLPAFCTVISGKNKCIFVGITKKRQIASI